MYIYRAINKMDERINPTKNGLIAKSIIDEVIYSDYELLLYSNFRKENNPLSQMTDKELNLIYREIRGNFNLDLHIPEIINIANMNQKIANDILRNVMLTNDEYFLSQFENILSTKNGHITNGSSIDYPWISFSTDLSLVRSYYEKQEKTIYSLGNYESEINNKIYDIDSLNYNIDLALEDVQKLKKEFKDYFLSYSFKEYDKAYKKIELIEKNIIDNKNKVYLIKEKLIKSKELNRNTLTKVKKLNDKN